MLEAYAARPWGPHEQVRMMARTMLLITKVAYAHSGEKFDGTEHDFINWQRIQDKDTVAKGVDFFGLPPEDEE